MSSIYVSFNLKSFSSIAERNDIFEKDYQAVYKPLIKFLYSHPEFSFSFSFSGTQLQFFKRRKNEIITILKQLIDRKQVEILGGGFYDPILPLLYTVDRNGQIDLLSAELRQAFGKRPRGASLFADCWDSDLVNTLSVSGFEYVLLDSSIVPVQKRKFLPLIMSEMGKSIEILPTYEDFVPTKNTTPEDFIKQIVSAVEKIEIKDSYVQMEPKRLVSINFTHEVLEELNEVKWFEKLSEYLLQNESCNVKTIIPTNYRKNSVIKVPCYIPAGIDGAISKWINRPFTKIETKQNFYTVHDFMETYPQAHYLYNRIMYISMLVNQYKKDKVRKKSARDLLWKAQNGTGLLCNSKGTFSKSVYRQKAYKYLMEAEKILRDGSDFKESINCFDYNFDGLNEYVCRMQNYFAYITLMSGAIQELELLKNTGNYADNYSRVFEFDSCADNYRRGIFIDHLFTKEQFDKYINNDPSGNGIFSRIQYSEVKISHNHHEVILSTDAVTSSKQRISLLKKYTINSNGMNIQYILKNNSDKSLHAIFVVESNISHTNFNPEDITYYSLDIVENDRVLNVDSSKSTKEQNLDLKKVSVIRLADLDNGVSFAFEPNEDCGYCYNPLIFKRPDLLTCELVPASMTFVSSQYWEINLEPQMETEKNINFTIASVKKERHKK